MPFLALACFLLCAGFVSCLSAADWPQYRGANTQGRSLETEWRSEWTTPPPTLWTASLGLGFGAVAVYRDRACAAGDLVVLDLRGSAA